MCWCRRFFGRWILSHFQTRLTFRAITAYSSFLLRCNSSFAVNATSSLGKYPVQYIPMYISVLLYFFQFQSTWYFKTQFPRPSWTQVDTPWVKLMIFRWSAFNSELRNSGMLWSQNKFNTLEQYTGISTPVLQNDSNDSCFIVKM